MVLREPVVLCDGTTDRDKQVYCSPFGDCHYAVGDQRGHAFLRAVIIDGARQALPRPRATAWCVAVHETLLRAHQAVIMEGEYQARAAEHLQREERMDEPIVRMDNIRSLASNDVAQSPNDLRIGEGWRKLAPR